MTERDDSRSAGPTTRAWLFVRGGESVRMIIDGPSLSVHGPGARVSATTFSEELDATLHQAAIEQSLVLDGFSLERLTTERRSAPQETGRADLRLVRRREDYRNRE